MPRIPSNGRYDSLDIWRGIACLLVLLNHALPYDATALPGPGAAERVYAAASAVAARLWIGVPIFFVISGYCISAAADNHRRKNAPVSRYFIRRFRRILPPYWAVLGATAIAIGVGDIVLHGSLVKNSGFLRPWWFSWSQWFGSITLTELWRPYLFGSQKALFLGHAWTLCYEEQFYAVSGVLLAVCPRRFFAGAAGVTVGVLALTMARPYLGHSIDGFFFDGNWILFALGILLYWTLNYGEELQRLLAAGAFAVVIVWSLLHGRQLLDVAKNPAQEFLVAGVFALIALLHHPWDRQLVHARLLSPIRVCGVMCYSLYLVHLPAINLLRAGLITAGLHDATARLLVTVPLSIVVSLWLGWAFHVHVERRFLNSQPKTARVEPRQNTALVSAAEA
ncbi:MAG: acyltransferase [Vicinamibacterales bacterium]